MPSLPPSIGSSFIELLQVESTNNYATGLVHEGLAHHGTVVFAHHQTKGKGQRNKQWISAKGENLTFTIILQPPFSLSEAFYLSMATAIAVAGVFEKHAKKEVRIKWPNDIYAGDRKAGGILVENILAGTTWKWAIAGIGLNINQVDFGELNAVSLKQITGEHTDPMFIGKEICAALDEILSQRNKHDILNKYHQQLYKKGEKARFRRGSRVFEGIVKGVTENGQLVVMHGTEEYFKVGEVEWIFDL